MRTIITHLKSVSPYSQSKHYSVEKLPKEIAKDYEMRTWRNRMHVDKDGNVFIPPMAFKKCLEEAAKYIGRQIPGKGKATYTKHFESGVLVLDPMTLPIKAADVPGELLFLPSDGKRGSGSRVEKMMPVIHEWEGDVKWLIMDETITKDVFSEHLREAGMFIGIGRFRPRNAGYYGRFEVLSVKEIAA